MEPLPFSYFKAGFNKLKKFGLVCLVLYAVVSLFFYFWSQSNPSKPPQDPLEHSRNQVYQLINDKNLTKTDGGKVYAATIQFFSCIMIGEVCTSNPNDAKQYASHSIMGRLNGLLTMPYSHPPASGIITTYVALQNAGFAPNAYAAEGVGLAALTPFKPIWLIFRNLILLIMVLIIVIIGFMIMFRAKINPQTVISIENALPKIAVALLLITFSYAIAGFLIDIMYVTMGLIAGLFKGPGLGFDSGRILSEAYFGTPYGLLGTLFKNNVGSLDNHAAILAQAFYDIIPGVFQGILNEISSIFLFRFAIIPALGWFKLSAPFVKVGEGTSFFGSASQALKRILTMTKLINPAENSKTPVISIIAGFILLALTFIIQNSVGQFLVIGIIWMVLMFSLLFIYFRLFFLFISEYVQILILTLFSPVILALEAIPGRNTFADWMKSLMIHLATFPIFLLLVLVSKAIMSQTSSELLWKPPYTYGFPSDAFQIIIAMALIYMAPEFIKMFKEMTGVKPMAASLNLGAFFSGATVAIGGAVGLASQFHSIHQMWVGLEGSSKGLRGALGFGGRDMRTSRVQGGGGGQIGTVSTGAEDAAKNVIS